MTAAPLTPEEEKAARGWAEVGGQEHESALKRRIFATLDAAHARIAELERLGPRTVAASIVDSQNALIDAYKRERDEARAEVEQWKEQARQFCQNADYWRAKAERAEPAVEAARAWNNASSDDGDEARRLERAVDALDAAEGKPSNYSTKPMPPNTGWGP